MPRPAPSRRGFLLATAGTGAALGLGLAAAGPAVAGTRPHPHPRPFGRYGSPTARRTPKTLYVDPHGRGDFTSVQAAVDAAQGDGWTLVLAPGSYRETVSVDASRTGATWIGASGDPRDVVIVYDNAAGTPKPDGSGTYGTSGSATTTVRADGFTARALTFANDWLRADAHRLRDPPHCEHRRGSVIRQHAGRVPFLRTEWVTTHPAARPERSWAYWSPAYSTLRRRHGSCPWSGPRRPDSCALQSLGHGQRRRGGPEPSLRWSEGPAHCTAPGVQIALITLAHSAQGAASS